MSLPLTPRVQRILRNISKADPENSTAPLLEQWKEKEENYLLRRGKFFHFCMGRILTPIYDGELIVGHFPYTEWNCNRCCLPDPLTEEEAASKKEQIDDDFLKLIGLKSVPDFKPWSEVFYGGINFGHVIVDYEKVLKNGLDSILREIDDRLQDDTLSQQQRSFLLSGRESVLGGQLLIRRYGDEALRLAQTAQPERAAELMEISRVCSNIASKPASSFREAVQLTWFTQLLLEIESGVSAFSYGRIDQYLYPYYRDDMEKGILTEEKAQELIDLLWLKNWQYPSKMSDPGRAVTIGGMLPDGTDGTNPLTYCMLEATRRLRVFQPKLNARIWKGSPEAYISACVRTARENCGPMLYCDEISIDALEKYGYSTEEARNFGIIGCYEMAVPGKECGNPMAAAVNIGKCLELAMNNGVSMTNGAKLGVQTGYLSDCKNARDLEQALQAQVEFALDTLELRLKYDAIRHSYLIPHPFQSILTRGCLQTGRDVSCSGAELTTVGVRMSGLIQTADSLTAVNKLVFEDKTISMERLWEGLRTNFENDEVLHAILVNKAPKYGNDIEEADQTARKLGQYLCNAISRRKHLSGAPLRPGLFSFLQFMNGENCAALPDGHRTGEPFANGVSPTHGRDRQGLTALLRSAAKLDYSLSNNAATLDIKLPSDLFAGEDGAQTLGQILRSYFEEGGMQVQLYFLSAEELRKAQEHPEDYAGLIVRVTGYSAYFIELAKNIQDEVIMRTAGF